MKENLHPDYHEINVVMTDGSSFVTRSTYGKAGDKLHLDIDSKTHPAWTGLHRLVDRGGQLAKFNKRFSGLGSNKEEVAVAPKTDANAKPEPKIKLTTTAASAKKK